MNHDRGRVLLDTVAGSVLYGLADQHSDTDRYVVVAGGHPRRHRHTSAHGDDRIIASLSAFLHRCEQGSHQALDAMFAPEEACRVDELRDLRGAFRAGTTAAVAVFRAGRAFSRAVGDDRFAVKRRRHGLRLVLCGNDLLEYGRYSPRLEGARLELVRSAGLLPRGEYEALLDRYSTLDLSQFDEDLAETTR